MKYDPEKHHRRSIRLRGYDYSQDGAYFVTICTRDRLCLFGEVVDGEMRLNDAGRIVEQCWLAIPDHFPHVQLDAFVVMPNHVHGIIIITHPTVPPVRANNNRTDDDVARTDDGANDYSPLHAFPRLPYDDLPHDDVSNTGVGAKNLSPLHAHSPRHNHPPCDGSSTHSSVCSPHDDVANTGVGANNHSPLHTHWHQHNHSPLRSPSKTVGSIIRGFKIGVTKWFRENTDVDTVWQRNYYEHIIRDAESLDHIREYILNNPSRWHLDQENPLQVGED